MISKYRKNQREDKQQLVFSLCLGLALIVIVGFLVVSNFRINQKRGELSAQREYLQRQLQVLEEKRDRLQAQISEAAKDDYLETEARERFNLRKSGEEVVAVLPPAEQPAPDEEKPWWNFFNW